MFSEGAREDFRSEPIVEKVRQLYSELHFKLAERTFGSMMDYLDTRRRLLEEESRYPIEFIEDITLEYVSARTQTAWKHNRDHHEIRYKRKDRLTLPHILAHEMEHIQLEYKAREVGRNRLFVIDAGVDQQPMRSTRDDLNKLERLRCRAQSSGTGVLQLIHGLADQLFNLPLDMVIEKRMFEHHEPLRPSQFLSLSAFQAEHRNFVTDNEMSKLAPPSIYRAGVMLNCAYALCIDHIYDGKTDYSMPYEKLGPLDKGKKLFEVWLEMMKNYRHGDEYTLVDEFARTLGLEGWFRWMPDQADELNNGGVTNPQLLKAKEPAAVWYCLGALQRYETISKEEIQRIAGEIALLGRSGIDYSRPNVRYSLMSVPGEQFSGLQLLCLMYVGFQKIDPALDIGLDLRDAYKAGLNLFRETTNRRTTPKSPASKS